MQHAEAIETNAADRYLLGQLSAAEADAFEEHYFDCAECAEDVRLGMSFLEAGRRLVREPAAPPAAPVVPIDSHPRRRGFRWIPAAAVAAILAIPVNIGLLMRIQSATPTLGVVALNPHVHFVGKTRTKRAPTTVKIPEGAVALLPIDVPPPPRPYGRYEARVLSDGDEVAARPLTPEMLQDTLTISLPDPGPGTYELVIVGLEPAGETEIVRHPFEVTR